MKNLFANYFLAFFLISSACSAKVFYVTTTDLYSPHGLNSILDSTVFHSGFDTIYFDIPGVPPHVIDYTTLPVNQQYVVLPSEILIDGDSQPSNGYVGNEPKIWITSSSGNLCYASSVHDVFIYSMKFMIGISASGSNITIGDYGRGNHFETDSYDDLRLFGVTNSYVRGNLFNGLVYDNIQLQMCDHIFIQGNKMGINYASDSTVNVSYSGIILRSGVTHTVIGGLDSAEKNVIAGACYSHIQLGNDDFFGPDTLNVEYNEILGNILGITEDLQAPLGNSFCSVMISGNVYHNVIGNNLLAGANWMANGIRYFDSIPQNNIFQINFFPCLNSYTQNSQGISILYSQFFPFGCGNGCKPNPEIDSVALNGVQGASVAFDTMRVYYTDTCEACNTTIFYLGKCIADQNGKWSFNTSIDTGKRVIVSGTDTLGNSSQFSWCSYEITDSIFQFPGININGLEPVSALSFDLFPNPSAGYFKIKLNQAGKFQISVLNEFGKVILSKQLLSSSDIINCTNWSNGIYSIALQNESGTIRESRNFLVLHD